MDSGFEPAYLELFASGELSRRAASAHERLADCDICPRLCGVDRVDDDADGGCRTGEMAQVSSASPHFGEEDPLVGRGGSGTIFFTGCNLACQYCQNYDISQLGQGREVAAEELAGLMVALQTRGCHNINFVSPSHVVPQILAALVIAVEDGLRLPLVYNSGGYDSLDTLALLDGVIDIYMPDMKYSDAEVGRLYSRVEDYPQVNQAAVGEMYRQVGDLAIGGGGVATRGLLVRHLVLPDRLAGTAEVVRFLAEEVSSNTYINVMAQYRPCYRADRLPRVNRRPSTAELAEAIELARAAGLRLDARRPRLIWR